MRGCGGKPTEHARPNALARVVGRQPGRKGLVEVVERAVVEARAEAPVAAVGGPSAVPAHRVGMKVPPRLGELHPELLHCMVSVDMLILYVGGHGGMWG